VLEHHGLVTWGQTHEASYELTLDLVDRAQRYLEDRGGLRVPDAAPALPDSEVGDLLARLRGELAAAGVDVVLHVDRRQRSLADRDDVEEVATAARATPDHILRIGARSIVLRDAADVPGVVAAFADEYHGYFARHAATLPDGTGMLDPVPRVALVPGLGCVAAGATPRAARMHADIAYRSHLVTAMALDAFGAVEWLTEEEIFAFDYWPMELRKLHLAPAPPPLTGRVVVVAGADAATSEAIGLGLAARGANIAADVADAVASFGGIDAVVLADGADEAVLERAEPVWRTQGTAGAIVRVGPHAATTAGADARSSAVVTDDGASCAAALAFLLATRADRLAGSVLRVR
jgi:hypothetical protein